MRRVCSTYARAKAIIAAITCASHKISHRNLRRCPRPIEFREVNASLRGLIRQCCHFEKYFATSGEKKKDEGNVCFVKIAQLLRALGKRLRPYSSGCSNFSEIPYLPTATTWKSSWDFKMSTLQRNKVDLLLHPKEDSNDLLQSR